MRIPRIYSDPSVIAVILLLAFSPALITSASSQGRTVPASFFGVSVQGITSPEISWPLSIPVGTLGKTEGTEWNDVEPSNGTFVWTRLDNSIAKAQGAGVTNFIYTFWSTPMWASSDPNQSCILTPIENVTGCAAPPIDINDWDTFVKAVVTRYEGTIQYYELWNEANLNETWSGSVSQMVTLAQHAYQDIKSIDPMAIVLSPSISSIGIEPYSPGCIPSECWLAEYFRAGGGNYSDEIAYHAYAYFTTDEAGSKVGIACTPGQIESCAGQPLVNEIQDIRALMFTYGQAAKPLIETEGGFPSDIISANLTGSSEQQTAYLSRWYIIQASENISTAVWFTEFSSGYGLAGFGTQNAEAEINQAYSQTYQWLVGSTMNAPCSMSSGSVWTCSMTLPDGDPAEIAFSNSSTASFYPSTQFSEYQELNGSVYPVSGAVQVGIAPVLLMTGVYSSSSSSPTETHASTISNSIAKPGGASYFLQVAAVSVVIAAAVASYIILRRRKI